MLQCNNGLTFCMFSCPYIYMVKWHNSGITNEIIGGGVILKWHYLCSTGQMREVVFSLVHSI